MIPMAARLKVKKKGRGVNLWLPLFLLWILLLPLGALLFVIWLILAAFAHLSVGAAVGAAGLATVFRVLRHLKGLRLEVRGKEEEIVLYMV